MQLRKVEVNNFSYGIEVIILYMYIISLYIFVDNVNLVKYSSGIYVLFLICACIKIIRKGFIYAEKSWWLVFGFHFISFASYFWANDKNIVIEKDKQLAFLILLMFAIYQILDSKRKINFIINSFIISGVVMFFYSLLIYGFDGMIQAVYSGERLGKAISMENTFGSLAAISTIITIARGNQYRIKILYLAAVLPGFLVLASGSRTGVLMTIIGIFILVIGSSQKKKLLKFLAVLPITVIAVYYLLKMPIFAHILKRFTEVKTVMQGGTADGLMRKNLIIWGLGWFLKKPFWGYGLANYGYLLQGLIGVNVYAHNNFVELLVDIGLIGATFYYSMHIYSIFHLHKFSTKDNGEAIVLLSLIIAWTLTEVSSVHYLDKTNYVILGIIFTYIRIMKHEIKQEDIIIKGIKMEMMNDSGKNT